MPTISNLLSLLTIGFISLIAMHAPVHTAGQHSVKVTIDSPVPVPPAGHPRLFIRNQHLSTLKKNIASNELKPIWMRMVELSKNEQHNALQLPDPKTGNFDGELLRVAEANALMFVMYKEERKGRKAIDLMSRFLQTIVFPEVSDITRKIGESIVSAAIVYDWCYPILAADEKALFIQSIKKLAKNMEIGYPPVKQGGIVGHGAEAQLMRDLLSAGIAVYSEDKEIYTLTATRFFNEYVPVRNYWYRSEMHHQGDSYGPYRFQWEMFATWIFDRMGYQNIFSTQQAQLPYRWIYTRRPDGQLLRDGDSFLSAQTKLGTYWASPFHLMLAGNYYKDPYLKHEFYKQNELSLGRYRIEDLWMILFTDPAVKTSARNDLPLTKYFSDPLGTMVARTGWDSGKHCNTVVAEMKIGGMWFGNHQHLDAGQFQLYYKGGLAIDAGIYEGTMGAYGSEHDINFHKRSIAHNTMLIQDPGEVFFWRDRTLANDGGQRIPNFGYEPVKHKDLFSKGYRVANVLAHETGPGNAPEFSYIKGDISKAYSGKVREFQRSFVFMNLKQDDHPAVLVVFDRVTSSNSHFKKSWLLHSIEEPSISGNTTTVSRTENDYHGSLINTTLLPELNNLVVKKIGGPGKEFEVSGTNYDQGVRLAGSSEEPGSWRTEVSPTNATETDHFLNVMQVMDKSASKALLTATMITNEKQIGAMISDRVILFSKDGNKLDKRVSFKILPNIYGDVKVLVTDLEAGEWMLTGPGKSRKLKYLVSADGSTLYFTGGSGTYQLTRVQGR